MRLLILHLILSAGVFGAQADQYCAIKVTVLGKYGPVPAQVSVELPSGQVISTRMAGGTDGIASFCEFDRIELNIRVGRPAKHQVLVRKVLATWPETTNVTVYYDLPQEASVLNPVCLFHVRLVGEFPLAGVTGEVGIQQYSFDRFGRAWVRVESSEVQLLISAAGFEPHKEALTCRRFGGDLGTEFNQDVKVSLRKKAP
jgi:hypothetical protein